LLFRLSFHLACAANLIRGTHLIRGTLSVKRTLLAFKAARHHHLGPIP